LRTPQPLGLLLLVQLAATAVLLPRPDLQEGKHFRGQYWFFGRRRPIQLLAPFWLSAASQNGGRGHSRRGRGGGNLQRQRNLVEEKSLFFIKKFILKNI